jgi:hypothetical protein
MESGFGLEYVFGGLGRDLLNFSSDPHWSHLLISSSPLKVCSLAAVDMIA